MKIIEKNNIILKNESISRDALFENISKIAEELNVTNDFIGVKEAFISRENQGTTGFEEGFAIPHARSKFVVRPQIFFYRSEKNIEDWESLDGKGVTKAIFLLIPDNAGNLHMDILSTIATKLLDEKFKNILNTGTKQMIFQELNEIIENVTKQEITPSTEMDNKFEKSFVAITACPAGIAKTFMAKERIQKTGETLGYSTHVETQGGGVQKNKMSEQQIDEAEFVIIASEIEINLERFVGKKIVVVKTKDAINNCEDLIKKAQSSKILKKEDLDKNEKGMKVVISSFSNKLKSSLLQIFNKPWFYLTILATFYAILNLVGYAMYSDKWFTSGWTQNQTLFSFQAISFFGFELCMPVFAGIFARKFYDKSDVFIVVFIFTFILNTPMIGSMSTFGMHGVKNAHLTLWFSYNGTFLVDSMMGTSLFGGILFAPLIAYSMQFTNNLKKKYLTNKYASIIFSHWITYLVIAFIFAIAFFIAAPFSWVFQWVIKALVIYPNSYWWLRFLIGGIVGILITWDYGGTINKITILFLIGMMQYDWRMRTLFAIAIPIASMSCGLFFKMTKKWVKTEDLDFVKTAQKLGKAGLSEGPIPFVNKYKWKAHLPSLISAFVATGFAFILNIQVFKTGSVGVLSFGAQGFAGMDVINQTGNNILITTNDIGWLNNLINPDHQSTAVTIISSFAYGVIGYYLSFIVGITVYFAVAGITFNIGNNTPFSKNTKKIKEKKYAK